jgi:polar amino acid transport system permease protein
VSAARRQTRGVRPLRLAGLLLLAALLVAGCTARRTSEYHIDWNEYFWKPLLQPDGLILFGVWLTVFISVVSQFLGVILGVLGALGKMAKFRPFRLVANIYIWIFRGTPLLVQIMLIYYGLLITKVYPWPPIDIPLLGFTISGEIQAGILALSVNEGAYMTEIVRAGILSIDPGQMEAAKSLGMTYGQAMRRIVLPQAARVIVPPLGNEFNNMLKTTSLLIVLGAVPETYFVFSQKNSIYFHPFELFLACAVWYLLLTTIWSIIQSRIERRLARGTFGSDLAGPSLRQRVLRIGRGEIPAGGAH